MNLKIFKGTRDFHPAQMAVREKVFNNITEIFRLHGAVTIDTPVFERKVYLLNIKIANDRKIFTDKITLHLIGNFNFQIWRGFQTYLRLARSARRAIVIKI